MYFNEELFKHHFSLAARGLDVQTIVEEANVPLFSVMRFKEGIIQNEVITDYYKICKWMGKDPLMYLIDMTSITTPFGVLRVNKNLSEKEIEELKKEWKMHQKVLSILNSNTTIKTTIELLRKPIVVVYLPITTTQQEVQEVRTSQDLLELESEYHLLVVISILEDVKIELLSTQEIDEEKYNNLVKQIENQLKL